MKPLDRVVYGIFNPHFWSGEPFPGGVTEMGELYCSYIRKAIANPDYPTKRNANGAADILLGGWSFGGMLSLEVAKQLADDPRINVIGILMVDSVHPVVDAEHVQIAAPDYSTSGKTTNQILSQNCMREARAMILKWAVPVWEDATRPRPPIILLRATDPVPREGGVDRVDVTREDQYLGWKAHDENMFLDVLPVKGHHFELYHFDRVDETADVMKKALDRLEKEAQSRR